METYHMVANERNLNPKQRQMYFRLGSEIQSSKTVRMGFRVSANYCHEIALAALDASNWKSLKAARAIVTVTRSW